jgi:hypothetical protein
VSAGLEEPILRLLIEHLEDAADRPTLRAKTVRGSAFAEKERVDVEQVSERDDRVFTHHRDSEKTSRSLKMSLLSAPHRALRVDSARHHSSLILRPRVVGASRSSPSLSGRTVNGRFERGPREPVES